MENALFISLYRSFNCSTLFCCVGSVSFNISLITCLSRFRPIDISFSLCVDLYLVSLLLPFDPHQFFSQMICASSSLSFYSLQTIFTSLIPTSLRFLQPNLYRKERKNKNVDGLMSWIEFFSDDLMSSVKLNAKCAAANYEMAKLDGVAVVCLCRKWHEFGLHSDHGQTTTNRYKHTTSRSKSNFRLWNRLFFFCVSLLFRKKEKQSGIVAHRNMEDRRKTITVV